MAKLYVDKDDNLKDEAYYNKAIEILGKLRGENNQYYATILSRLANIYVIIANYVEADPLYQKIAQIHREVLGDSHMKYMESLEN